MTVSRAFRRRVAAVLSKEQAERQGRAARIAWEALPEEGAALAFLNGFDVQLGGRPIDLAVASAQGLSAVEQALARTLAARSTVP